MVAEPLRIGCEVLNDSARFESLNRLIRHAFFLIEIFIEEAPMSLEILSVGKEDQVSQPSHPKNT